MKIYINHEQEWREHIKCRGIRLVGYRIVQTIDESGNRRESPKVIASTDDTSKYEEAMNFAIKNRKFIYNNGKPRYEPWCVVASAYSCGHIIY